MKKSTVVSLIIASVLVLCAFAGFFFCINYLVIDGTVYEKDASSLDLSGKPIEDLEKLAQFTALEHLDVRNTGLTVEEYTYLQNALPNCEIAWLLPFQGSYLPLDSQTVTVTELTEEEISLLAYLSELKTVDATGCQDLDILMTLKARSPNLDIRYRLTLGNTVLEQDAESLASASIEHISAALSYLPNLKTVDASGCTDFDELLALKAQYPGCEISYLIPFCGQLWPDDTKEMEVNAASAAGLSEILPYLPQVTKITVAEPIPDPEAMISLVESHPDLDLTFSFPLMGQTVSNAVTHLDISGNELTSVEAIEQYMPLFTQLEKVDMCGCGISNEEMAALNQRHPDTLFVWEVQMGNFKLRTDITFFMPYQYRYQVTDADADTLKYLTELICIDFGHMDITRTDYLAYMPKMQYLLMCDTPITDISYLANMKDLKYVELFMTKVTDFSPLLECKNLVDLNICYTYPDDPMIFAQMTQLENLWFRGDLDYSIREALRAALPNTRMLFGPGSSTGRGWRRLPNYYAMRDLLGMPYMEEP